MEYKDFVKLTTKIIKNVAFKNYISFMLEDENFSEIFNAVVKAYYEFNPLKSKFGITVEMYAKYKANYKIMDIAKSYIRKKHVNKIKRNHKTNSKIFKIYETDTTEEKQEQYKKLCEKYLSFSSLNTSQKRIMAQYMSGRSYKDIAENLGCSRGFVLQMVKEGKEKIRKFHEYQPL